MSRKHVQEYYKQILKTRAEFLKDEEELKEACSNNLVNPSILENHKKAFIPIEEAYNRWSYMIYLLDMPNKKDKRKSYEKRNKEKINSIPNKYKDDDLINENKSK